MPSRPRMVSMPLDGSGTETATGVTVIETLPLALA
jgi:hypothetical protein